jgi:hypothetical protein
MNKDFIPYEQALALKGLGFDEPCMYAWCITPEHRVEYDGKMYLKTNGNPFGQFYKGKNFNGNYNPNKNRIQCSAPTYSQAINFLYICSDKQIDIELKGSDTHEERIRKIEQGCKDLWNLQNNKSK